MQLHSRHILHAAVLAAGLAAAPAWADVKAGIDAWQAQDYAAAVNHWRPLADKGDADAQYNLAHAYRVGRGVAPDLKLAEQYYERAAKQGHPQAEANYGLLLFQNGERRRAMPYVQKGAEMGDPRAQYILGTALFNGDIVSKDAPMGYALMTRAAAQGLPPAADSLKQMDRMLSAQERERGIALARQLEQPARTAAAAPPPRGPAGPPPSAARTQLPPAAPASAPAPAAQAQPARPAPATAPAPAAQAAAPAAAPAGWRVQLGAFSTADNARRHWGELSGKVNALSGLQPILQRAGAITRLQAGPAANRAAADRLCGAVKAAGQACFVVAP